jgi:hypothetical protein
VVKRITLVSQDDNDNVKDINPNFYMKNVIAILGMIFFTDIK